MNFEQILKLWKCTEDVLSFSNAIKFLTLTNYSYENANALLPSVQKDDKGDAFRHILWSAVLTLVFGAEIATKLTTRYEDFTEGNPEKSRNMDLHNNKIGVNLGTAFRQEIKDEIEKDLTADSKMCKYIINLIDTKAVYY